ncbi:MAG: hypothetical protein K0V04_32180, partial [Deltaproteobacteria bacterium]|nr:hypothetical protein [Deltaproteobacteria bacterium]
IATNVVVETTGDHTPELKVSVRASVSLNLRYPKRIGFVLRDGEFQAQTIRIATRRGDPPKIKEVEDPDDILDVEVLEPEGTATPILLRIRGDAREKIGDNDSHEFFVHTDDPDEPKVAIRYGMSSRRPPKKTRFQGQRSDRAPPARPRSQ